MKKLSMVALTCLSSLAVCGSAFAANEVPNITSSSTENAPLAVPISVTYIPITCANFDPQTGGLKGAPQPPLPRSLQPENCPAVVVWNNANHGANFPEAGLKGWTPNMGVGPALTPQGKPFPAQLPVKPSATPPNLANLHPIHAQSTFNGMKPYKCSDFNPKTGALKGWTPEMGIGPAIPASELPLNCPALKQHNTAPQPQTATFNGMKPYKCSDFNPKTGALKGWTPEMGLGPAIPAQLLPKNCPALMNH